MAYRNLDAHRRGGGEAGSRFAWPWPRPQAPKLASTRSHPLQVPHIERWEDPLCQPHMTTAQGPWPYSVPASTVRPSSSPGTPLHNRQIGPTIWRQNRAATTGGAFEEIPTSSLGIIAIPVEVALKRLFDAITSCKSLCEEYRQLFQQQAGQTTSWARCGTLDKLWCDMIARHGGPDRFRDVTDKFKSRLFSLRGVLNNIRSNNVEHSNVAKQDPGVIERRLRAANKAELHCDGLLELTHRARTERMACALLVEELGELTAMLDPKTHPVLYFDSDEEKVESTKGKRPAQLRQKTKGPSTREEKAAAERDGTVAPDHFTLTNNFGHSSDGGQQDCGENDYSQEQEQQQTEDEKPWVG